LTPQLLKPAVAKSLNELLAPIQAAYQVSTEWKEIALKAYPPPPKKEKKVKDKGSRHPGAVKVAKEKEPNESELASRPKEAEEATEP
jgi:tyrosyl-tRNA synthetase